MQRRKARPNRIFMLEDNWPLPMRGHFKWTQNISERVLLKHRRCVMIRVVKALVSLSILFYNDQ